MLKAIRRRGERELGQLGFGVEGFRVWSVRSEGFEFRVRV